MVYVLLQIQSWKKSRVHHNPNNPPFGSKDYNCFFKYISDNSYFGFINFLKWHNERNNEQLDYFSIYSKIKYKNGCWEIQSDIREYINDYINYNKCPIDEHYPLVKYKYNKKKDYFNIVKSHCIVKYLNVNWDKRNEIYLKNCYSKLYDIKKRIKVMEDKKRIYLLGKSLEKEIIYMKGRKFRKTLLL